MPDSCNTLDPPRALFSNTTLRLRVPNFKKKKTLLHETLSERTHYEKSQSPTKLFNPYFNSTNCIIGKGARGLQKYFSLMDEGLPQKSSVHPIADRVAQDLEIVSKTFSTNQNSAHGIHD